MNKRNKKLTSVLAAFLAVVMVLSMVPVSHAEAARTQKLTIYVGEEGTFIGYGNVRRVTSSKKSVVSAKKDSNYPSTVKYVAKKAGKATVTVKTVNETRKYIITVKKSKFTTKIKYMRPGYLLLSVKNNTKQIFDHVKVRYTLKDENGNTVVQDKVTVGSLIPGKESYTYIYYSYNSYTVDASKCKAKVVTPYHTYSYSYKNRSSKIEKKILDKASTDKELTFNLRLKNKMSSEKLSGYVFILLYDDNGNVIDVMSRSFYLNEKSMTTCAVNVMKGNGVVIDHYKILIRAYSSKFRR